MICYICKVLVLQLARSELDSLHHSLRSGHYSHLRCTVIKCTTKLLLVN